MVAALTGGASAQPADFSQRLREGQLLRAHDRFAEARQVYRALLQDVRKDSSNHRLEALVLDNLGVDEQDSGDYAAAETAFNHGISVFSAQAAADDPILVALKSHLAELYIAEIRPDDAEPLLRQTVAALRSSRVPSPIQLSVSTEDLAVVFILRRKFAEPEVLLRDAQSLIENAVGPDDPRLTSSLMTYAGLLIAQHRFAAAIEPAERALRLVNTTAIPITKPYIASVLSVLSAVYFHAGRRADAISYAHKAVEIAEASLGPQHPRLGLYLANYAYILRSGGHRNEAKAAQKRADEIVEQHPLAASRGYTVNVAALR